MENPLNGSEKKSPKSSMEHPQALIKDDRLIAGKIIEKSKER